MVKKYTADDIVLVKPKLPLVDSVDLTEAGFKANLNVAIDRALEFAKSLVTNKLQGELKYLVLLEGSYGEFGLDKAKVVDDTVQEYTKFSNLENVTKLLWRSGAVPEWINVYVVSETAGDTNIKLDCCNRFTDDPKLVYHVEKGIAPFHVLGPPVPADFDISSGLKYKI